MANSAADQENVPSGALGIAAAAVASGGGNVANSSLISSSSSRAVHGEGAVSSAVVPAVVCSGVTVRGARRRRKPVKYTPEERKVARAEQERKRRAARSKEQKIACAAHKRQRYSSRTPAQRAADIERFRQRRVGMTPEQKAERAAYVRRRWHGGSPVVGPGLRQGDTVYSDNGASSDDDDEPGPGLRVAFAPVDNSQDPMLHVPSPPTAASSSALDVQQPAALPDWHDPTWSIFPSQDNINVALLASAVVDDLGVRDMDIDDVHAPSPVDLGFGSQLFAVAVPDVEQSQPPRDLPLHGAVEPLSLSLGSAGERMLPVDGGVDAVGVRNAEHESEVRDAERGECVSHVLLRGIDVQ